MRNDAFNFTRYGNCMKNRDFVERILTTEIKNGEGNIIMQLKDSGDRRNFDTGAVRDMAEGKGRCDLLPAAALLRLSKLYEAGAKKYAARNWEKGIPISVMVDSGMRHLLKYLDGWTDEDHLTAAAWNILGAMWMEEKHPELQDLPSRVENTSSDVNSPSDGPTLLSDDDREFLSRALISGGINDIETLMGWLKRRL